MPGLMKKYLPLIAAGLAGGVLAGGIVAVADGGGGTQTVVEQAPLGGNVKDVSSNSNVSARDIYKRYSDGVAYITAKVVQETSASPFGDPSTPQQGTATGTGFVVDKQGDILTNAHVVEGAKSVTVQLGDDKKLKAK